MNDRLRGFTLIEVLIAMLLLSIMMLLLFSSLRISARNWDAGENRMDQVSQIAAVQNFFQRHLSTARPESSEVSPGRYVFGFQGERNKLQFVSALPASAARQGVQKFTLMVRENDGQKNLLVGVEPFYPAAFPEQWKKEEVILIKGISELKLSYFGALLNEKQASWHNKWQDQKTLPLLIKIALQFDNSMLWPVMQVAPRINSLAAPAGGGFSNIRPF